MTQRKDARRAAGTPHQRPMVAIVGRPNVGKSTLFNRLVGQSIAIVEDIPGVTRDRNYADAWALGHEFILIDTGGFDPQGDDPMKSGIAHQIEIALQECDAIICVFDATTDPLPADHEAISLLRRTNKSVVYVANKADSINKSLLASTYYELGIDQLIAISALHGASIGDLEEAIVEILPAPKDSEPTEEGIPRVAIIGRPNAGKSSLINKLCGEERQLVDDRPGTTVDSIDTLISTKLGEFILVDTAGIRRKRSIKKQSIETLSVYQAIRSVERSDVAVLMIDANQGVGEQDAKIANLVIDRGKALIIALNKVDLLNKEELKKASERTREILRFASWAPLLKLSAKEGRGTKVLLSSIHNVVAEHQKRITTGELNRFFEEILERHPPPTMNQRPVRLFYITQARNQPPTFFIVTNEPKGIQLSYQRYVINQIRERFGFEGTPLRVRYRGRKRK